MNIQSRILSINRAASPACRVMIETAMGKLQIMYHINPYPSSVNIDWGLSIRNITITHFNIIRLLEIDALPAAEFRMFVIRIAGSVGHGERNTGIFLANSM